MARGSLRRFDVQAKWSLLLAAASVLPLAATGFLLARNFKPELRVISYATNSLYRPVLLAAIAATMLLSAAGLVLGINSAGQRRNDLQRRSWAGFFLGTGVLAISFILFAAFWMLQMAKQ